MMKFFRKYNKHLLAVFMALLLVIWLGGDAIDYMVRSGGGDGVIATASTGPITAGELNRSQYLSDLQQQVGLSWQQSFINAAAPTQEQLTQMDWILLVREAEKYGVSISPAQAKAELEGRPGGELIVRRAAIRRDAPVEHVYEAAAEFYAVNQMLTMFAAGLNSPEPQLRTLARDVRERAVVEAVALPADAFADPEQTFTEAELQAQYEEYKEKPRGQGGLTFGYYLDPQVKIEYIQIDTEKIKANLSDSGIERRAYTLWKENRETPLFRRTAAEIEAIRADLAGDADTTGATPTPPPVVAPFYESFNEARDKAVDAVLAADAQGEADRIANTLARMLLDPWVGTTPGESGFKPAPDAVKTPEYYAATIAALPANMQIPGAVEAGARDWIDARGLADTDGVGQAMAEQADGSRLRLAQIAFNVEGLVTIPEDSEVDRDMYISLWQTLSKPLMTQDGTLYLVRVTGAREGRAPTGLDEVIEDVADDLRLQAGMAAAKEAAEAFVAGMGTNGLKEAWEANAELVAKVTPDRGGYVPNVAVSRDTSKLFGVKNLVPALGGRVTDAFIAKAFELAAKEPNSELAILDLPDMASVVVIKGQAMNPLYEEDYRAQRMGLKRQMTTMAMREVLFGTWLNAKHVRERNEFKRGNEG